MDGVVDMTTALAAAVSCLVRSVRFDRKSRRVFGAMSSELVSCRRSGLVELHDGGVEIESVVNKDTTVRCHLPRRVSDTDLGMPKAN